MRIGDTFPEKKKILTKLISVIKEKCPMESTMNVCQSKLDEMRLNLLWDLDIFQAVRQNFGNKHSLDSN